MSIAEDTQLVLVLDGMIVFYFVYRKFNLSEMSEAKRCPPNVLDLHVLLQ